MNTNKTIIDVREPYEYVSGHAEGAINIPLSQMTPHSPLLKNVAKDSEIIVYCRSGARANSCIEVLKQVGYSNIINGISAENVVEKYL